MSKDLAIMGAQELITAINTNEYVEEPEAWENLVMSITELHNRILATQDDDLIMRWVNHTYSLALAVNSFVGDFPDTALFDHVLDTVEWMSNLC